MASCVWNGKLSLARFPFTCLRTCARAGRPFYGVKQFTLINENGHLLYLTRVIKVPVDISVTLTPFCTGFYSGSRVELGLFLLAANAGTSSGIGCYTTDVCFKIFTSVSLDSD